MIQAWTFPHTMTYGIFIKKNINYKKFNDNKNAKEVLIIRTKRLFFKSRTIILLI